MIKNEQRDELMFKSKKEMVYQLFDKLNYCISSSKIEDMNNLSTSKISKNSLLLVF